MKGLASLSAASLSVSNSCLCASMAQLQPARSPYIVMDQPGGHQRDDFIPSAGSLQPLGPVQWLAANFGASLSLCIRTR